MAAFRAKCKRKKKTLHTAESTNTTHRRRFDTNDTQEEQDTFGGSIVQPE